MRPDAPGYLSRAIPFMARRLTACLIVLLPIFCFAGRITGVVTDSKGQPLGFASILVKDTKRGVTANSAGRYSIELLPGTRPIRIDARRKAGGDEGCH